jgi:glycosyltransferase involved in cell wall biosynthesis
LKRVLHVGKFYPPVAGGMERVVETLCSASTGLVESRVLVANTDRQTVREERCGVQVTRVSSATAVGSVHIAPAFATHLRRAEADLMVLHEPNPWALLSYALARPRMPLAIWYHSDVVRSRLQYALFYAPLARLVYRRAAVIVVSSPALAEHADHLAPYRDRIRIVPFGIDPSRWARTDSVAEAAARIRDDVGAPFVLFAGRHVPYKGVDVLLRALAGTSISAIIAGDGPMRQAWERLAAATGLGSCVRFCGEISHERLQALMHACAALVLPSVTRAEAFGYVQLEAMACGKPVISTDVPSGVSWVNQHERTGLVVPAGDAQRLRNAIVRLMMDEGLRARLGEAGRARVDREFTHVRLRERLAALYTELSLLEPSSDVPHPSDVEHLFTGAPARSLDTGHLSDVGLFRGASRGDSGESFQVGHSKC